MTQSGETPEYLIGWCEQHRSMAEVWSDGSIGCHFLTVVETRSDDCSVVPIPTELLLTAENGGPT